MKMLLHVCCGPCASATIPYWQRRGTEPLAFFYNPNIHPLLEYRRRLGGMEEVAEWSNVPLAVDSLYDPEAWFEGVSGPGGGRCRRCIGMRLERSAGEAVKQECDAFSTSLAISPWQDHDAMKAAGMAAAERFDVEFVYEDLRSEYPESRRVSKQQGLYRQKYCGCLVSEWERYREKDSSEAPTSR